MALSPTFGEFIDCACASYGCTTETIQLASQVNVSGPGWAADHDGVEVTRITRERRGKQTRILHSNLGRKTRLNPNTHRSFCARLGIPYSA